MRIEILASREGRMQQSTSRQFLNLQGPSSGRIIEKYGSNGGIPSVMKRATS